MSRSISLASLVTVTFVGGLGCGSSDDGAPNGMDSAVALDTGGVDAKEDVAADTHVDVSNDAVDGSADAPADTTIVDTAADIPSDAPSDTSADVDDGADAAPSCATCVRVTTKHVRYSFGLVVDASSVYWAYQSTFPEGGLWSVAKTGAAATELAPGYFSHFYVPTAYGGKIWWQGTRSDGVPEYLYSCDIATKIFKLEYDDTSLNMTTPFLDRTTGDWYWSNQSSGPGQMYVLHPGATTHVAFGPSLKQRAEMNGADAAYFYGSEGPGSSLDTVYRMDRTTGAVETYSGVPSATGDIYVLGVDATSIYYEESRKVYAFDKTTLAVTSHPFVVDSPSYALVDGSDVYTWDTVTPGITRTRAGTTTTISTGTLSPKSIALDATNVYFVTHDPALSGDISYDVWSTAR